MSAMVPFPLVGEVSFMLSILSKYSFLLSTHDGRRSTRSKVFFENTIFKNARSSPLTPEMESFYTKDIGLQLHLKWIQSLVFYCGFGKNAQRSYSSKHW